MQRGVFLDPGKFLWVLFTTIWRANRETLFFRLGVHRPTFKGEGPQSNSTMDPAKLAKLQAQAASNRIGTSISVTSGRVSVFCQGWVLLTASARVLSVFPCSGGKGTVRRKIVRKSKPSNTQDDKKLQGALKKLNVQPITGVEEVNMFREDGNVLHFSAPKGE